MPTKLILVDGSSYLYRAFHALPALTNSAGEPTGAVFGVINMLKRLMIDFKPEHMIVIFDAKGKTFRSELYPEYKATRKEMPSELIQQIDPIHQIIEAMGIPLISLEGVEADDVIGTLATYAQKENIETIISTGDKDMAQLVNKQVTLINTMSNSMLDPLTVKDKFGVRPDQIIDYLTLVGDTSDNIPGVPKVGPKTAAKWLEEYETLDNIVTNAEKFSGKVGEYLRASIAQFPLTKQLVTIKCDINIPFAMEQFRLKEPDQGKLAQYFKRMEFKSWLADALEKTEKVNTDQYSNYRTITSEKELLTLVKELQAAKLIAFDTETTSLNALQADLVGLSFATAPGNAVYIPIGHNYPGAPEQLRAEWVLEQLKPVFTDPALKKVGQHSKYDLEVLARAGIEVAGIAHDTMLLSYINDSVSSNHSMDALALKYLGWKTIAFTDVAGKGAKQKTFNEVEVEKASIYAAEDADVTLRLCHNLWPRIENEPGLKHIYTNIEIPLIPVLARMEQAGILLDPILLAKHGKDLEARLIELEKEAYAVAGCTFNINSPKQLQEILFQTLKLPVLQKTPTGQPSTADPVLQELALDFAMPKLIIEYRSLSKLISTYTTRLIEQINPETKRVHTSYNQAGAATGRLSSSDPNLQNIPIRSKEGRKIREAFIAKPGYKLVSADYSQIELRLMAHIAKDPSLLHAFANDIDIHKATAAEVFGVPLDKVTNDLRRNAKAINFGLLYGMSAFGLAKQLGIDRKAAQDYIERYFARYPNVRGYMDSTRQLAREKGFVETLYGRRLYLPDINAQQIPRQRAAERMAINAPLQGSAADIIKMAMLNMDNWLQTAKPECTMLLQVHDELVFEVKETALEAVCKNIKTIMENVVKLDVPLLVSVGIGDNWDKASDH